MMSLESKSNWNIPEKIKEDDVVQYLLKKRGIDEEEKFLNPSISDVPNYTNLYDTAKAAKKK